MIKARTAFTLAALVLGGFSNVVEAIADESVPPMSHVIPRRVFEIVVDGFDQVSSASVACGALPGEIATIISAPAVDAGEGFSFDGDEKSLTLRMKQTTGKNPIEAGKFSWSGAILTWSGKTFPSKDVGTGLKRLRAYLSSCSFVATLKDGRVVVLFPPPTELNCAVTMHPDGILLGSIDTVTLPVGAIVSVEGVSGGAWVSSSSDAGISTGTVAGNAFIVRVEGGKCTVQQDSPRLIELRELVKQLRENKQLATSLPEKQRRILEVEDAATTAKVAALKVQVETDRLPDLKAVLRIRATDAVSGRVYGIVTTTIGE